MTELYYPTAALTNFHEFVRQAAQGLDGREAVREINFSRTAVFPLPFKGA